MLTTQTVIKPTPIRSSRSERAGAAGGVATADDFLFGVARADFAADVPGVCFVIAGFRLSSLPFASIDGRTLLPDFGVAGCSRSFFAIEGGEALTLRGVRAGVCWALSSSVARAGRVADFALVAAPGQAAWSARASSPALA